MWLRFAPLRLPLRRRLQTAAVLQWVFSFLALAQCCLGLYLVLLLGDGWLLALGYAAWLYLDWETPSRGGRRSAWVRGWAVWRYFRDYFPITLVKTAKLDPSHNYLFGFHPHGILVAGAFGNFCTEATGFSQLFPGLTPHLLMLPFWFKVPFFRDYIMSGGLVSSEKASVSYLLGHEGGGQVAVIAVGGPPESLDARPGALTLQLRSRKGFIKMALRHGAALVPVFSFGENELFNQVSNPRGSVIRRLQEGLQKAMGLALPLFHARGVFQYSFGLLPFRRPIYTIVGAPIMVPKTPHPSGEAIDELHETYLEKLTQLFEEHKAKSAGEDDPAQAAGGPQRLPVGADLPLLRRLLHPASYLPALHLLLVPECALLHLVDCGFGHPRARTTHPFLDAVLVPAGGRRSEWMRRWKVWELHRDYFPIKLVKTAELPPTRNYILGSHPHGIICAGAFSAFSTEACGFSRVFPGLTSSLALLAGLFYLPVYREYMMSSGMVPVSKKSLDFLLRTGPGHAVVIVVGGASESLDCNPGEQRLRLSGRRGFVRLALQHGADLVPVFSFGENDIFRQVRFPEGSLLRRLQLRFKQLSGFAPCLFVGRSLFSSHCWGLLPQPSPITVVVGKPIPVPLRPQPNPEEVDRYHALYVQALQQLFEEHKGNGGLPPSQQLFIT